ncbi:MAG: hypothetical protein M1119_04255 [Firmicutes bacterium]|nr:hypothetical protein [Bacillota bacterium]
MINQFTQLVGEQAVRRDLAKYFIDTGFYDLLPMALKLANSLGYDTSEMIEAICKVNDKFNQFLPTKNRTAWFKRVFEEKLGEARGDILTHRAKENICRIDNVRAGYLRVTGSLFSLKPSANEDGLTQSSLI